MIFSNLVLLWSNLTIQSNSLREAASLETLKSPFFSALDLYPTHFMSTSCLSSQQTMAISAHKMDMFKEPMLITKYFYLQSWTNFGIYIYIFWTSSSDKCWHSCHCLHHGKTLQIWKKDLIVPSNCKSVVMKIKAISRHNYSFFALPVMCLPFLIRLIYHTRTILPASLMRRSLSSSS